MCNLLKEESSYDSPKEYCGIFGVFGHQDAARLTYYGLYALQHRGQESAGIAVSDGENVTEKRGMGLVPDVFQERDLNRLKGHVACGHVRYSTTGSSVLANVQPFIIHFAGHTVCLGHNGNLVNAAELKRRLEREGSIFQTTMDSEVVMHLLTRNIHMGFEDGLVDSLKQLQGAFGFLFMTEDTLVAARDPHGLRPLCIGVLEGGGYVVASETCALDLIDATYLRQVEPGEVVFINKKGLRSVKPFPQKPTRQCIFEFVYFARPDSVVYDQTVYEVRKRQGAQLAKEYPHLKGDLVMPFPDSGNYAALGFAAASNLPFEMGMIRNHYVGRTFIQPTQDMRSFGVRVKLNPVRELIKGKKVIIVEDSIIRGTTTVGRVKNIRDAGATEVHMVVSCPPHRFPCHYGIDFSTKGELIASKHSVDEIATLLGLDSLNYLSLEGLLESSRTDHGGFCTACFDGKYPVPVGENQGKFCLEK
ncbi:amidophosphoribosyltransferase [Dethiosulfatarculus sandiegensis]|uniref:Amidophosphoribosyltransferase n=1 Tax=Dethiosulfatarculus sandiegensis TaxID=1429043 RepID=A0A0D2GLM9_9BACT|nr:amidophosphoribosyltransferase [Dethiosulfatarculus sandiegensis]KIX15562.1 amidophosphoribosyltransferase [Dethiosulfatarculus sandiegensis]